MRYAQIKSGHKLHLVFEADGVVSNPLCGTHVDGYRMTINVPLGHACKRCMRVYHQNGGAKRRRKFFEFMANGGGNDDTQK